MGSTTTYFSYVIFYNKTSLQFQSQMGKITYQLPLHQRISYSIHPSQAYLTRNYNKPSRSVATAGRLGVHCSPSASSEPDHNDNRAVETVLKLYTAIKNKNFSDLSDIIGEECLCTSNFISSFQPLRGKEQVMAFFSSLMARLGNNIEFVVQPIFHDGLNVGVSWKLEWKETQISIGKGFSFYMCHIYQGKVIIKNVEILLEPIVDIEPIRLKMITSMASSLDNLSGQMVRALKILIIFFLLMAALFSFLRISNSNLRGEENL